MISTIFPTPYPDELLYSVCARYAARMRFSSANIISEQLFGSRNVVAVTDLPSRLDTLSSRLPKQSPLDANTLIDHHTLLPFYAPFIPNERLQRIRSAMRGNKGGTIHTRLGIMAGSIPMVKRLRFCTACVMEDRQRYEECYWHRVHQIAGIDICPDHRCLLQESAASSQRQTIHYAYTAAEDVIPQIFQESPAVPRSHLYAIAKQAAFLLNNGIEADSRSFFEVYRANLESQGFVTIDGSVRMQQLHAAFVDFYTSDLLANVSCSFDGINETWLARIVRSDRKAHHPLRHLLVLHFFGQRLETVLYRDRSMSPAPFGFGPWPCLNKVCPHSHQDVIPTCSIKYSRYAEGKPIGTFACTHCGFTYTRTGPDSAGTTRFEIGKIQAFGPLWEDRLKNVFEHGTLSLRAMSRLLGVDVMTIKRQAQRLLTPMCDFQDEAAQAHIHLESDSTSPNIQDKHRHTWLNMLESYPELGISVLRQRANQTYTWLYRHDKEWLNLHKPCTFIARSRPARVDWKARDELLAKAVDRATIQLLNRHGPPRRITVAAIGRITGRLMLIQQHRDKLPKTAQRLDEAVESREDWALRRLRWTIEHIKEQGLILRGWEIVRRAGLSRFPKQWFEIHGIEF